MDPQAGEDSLGLSYEKEVKANGSIEHKHYLSIGGMVFAMQSVRTQGNSTPIDAPLRYFHHDHLGSIAAISNETGDIVERMAYDPWGKRRNVNGLPDTTDSLVGIATDRGFTGHEQLDEMGVIHMNGRIYDPLVGRFMSADPFIQAPDNLQSYNRYSYVINNPLSLTDPTGYNWFKRLMRLGDRISSIGVSLGSPALYRSSVNFLQGSGGYQLKSAALGYVSLYCGPWVAACNGGFQAGLAKGYGASDRDAFKAGAVAAISSGAFQLAGGIGGGSYGATAAAGCVSAAAGGGNCGRGAVSALFGKYATNNFSVDGHDLQADVINGIIATVAGGVGSVIAGGKFENGATTAAYGYLFNAVTSWRAAEQSSVAALRAHGDLFIEQVALTVTDSSGKTMRVIADSVGIVGDKLLITEVKDGLGAKLSPGQKAMFEVAFGEGKIAIESATIAKQFGLEAGTNLLSQVGVLEQISVRLEATIGSRAARQLARMGGGHAIGGVLRVLGGPVATVIFEFGLYTKELN
jgi:RHS repeat-associated protein